MRILVTGGKGYLGGRLCQFLTALGKHQVFSASRNPAPDTQQEVVEVLTNWASQESLHSCCKGMDAIVHLAAMNADDSRRDPVSALAMNGVGTARLLEAAKATGVHRFIYMSTAHVYGSPLVGTLTEDTCPSPLHPYATSHRAAEDLVRAADRLGIVEGIVLRLSNSFGAPVRVDTKCWELLFNDLCRQVITSGTITLQSTGMQRRDFVPIADVCSVVHHFLELPPESLGKRLFNVGGNWSPTVYEAASLVADRFEQRTGSRPTITRVPPAPGEFPTELDYRTNRLRDTGFRWATDKLTELDNLISFCESAFRTKHE